MKFNKRALIFVLFLIALIFAARIYAVVPSGATIVFVSNSSRNATYPDNRTDDKGTITVLRLNTIQQNDRWKAYVGNVSGRLTLDDANSYTIYDWSISGTVRGTVFASRNNTVSWTTINCSNLTYTRQEETFLSHTFSSIDSIENTFDSTNHTEFYVGDNLMRQCNYTALYVNDNEVVANDSAAYQEMILWDGVGAFVYAARINDSGLGYRASDLYDFQMIVAEKAVVATPVTYFFFVELQ